MLGPAHGLPSYPVTPQTVPLAHWYHHGWQIQATCQCGRVSIVHMGALIRKFGEQTSFSNHTELRIAEMCRCMRCGKSRPKLAVVKG